MPENPWGNLAVRLAIAAGVAAAVVAAARLASLAVAPLPAVLVALVVGTFTWLGSTFEPLAPRPEFQEPHPPAHSARFTADVATRRVANMFVRVQPGAAFEAGTTAHLLDDLVQQRLDGEDPRRLSPNLRAYLQAAHDGRPQPLTRRALHAHLKEIDQL